MKNLKFKSSILISPFLLAASLYITMVSNAAFAQVALGAVVTKNFTAPGSISANEDNLLTITINNPNVPGNDATDVSLTDTLPTGLTYDTSLGATNNCGGTISLTATELMLAGGTLDTNITCTITVNVTGTIAGPFNNVIHAADVTYIINGSTPIPATAPASDTLVVVPNPSVTKLFNTNPINANQTTNMTLTITNPNASTATGVALSDTLPSHLTAVALVSNTCNGAVTFPVNTDVLLTGGTINANSSCTIVVTVMASEPGSFINTINAGQVVYNIPVLGRLFNIDAPSDTLIVNSNPAVVSKQFVPGSIAPNQTSVLTITIANNNGAAANGVDLIVNDTLPSGLIIVSPAATTTCHETLTANAGSSAIALTGGTISGNGTCTITVNVTSATAGTYTNTIAADAVSFVLPLDPPLGIINADPAVATLVVTTPASLAPTISEKFSPRFVDDCGCSTLTITLTNPSTAVSTLMAPFAD